jgi:hypothetical protein
MSATMAAPERIVYRKSVMFCVLPAELGRHLGELTRYYEGSDSAEIVVERRDAADRRASNDGAPRGVERRVGERRDGAETRTAAELEMELPRSLRRHADRIVCTWRSIPVHFQEADREADALLAAADSDGSARDELRLRYHARVYGNVSRHTLTRRGALDATDKVFDELFEHHESGNFGREVSQATGRALATR